MATTWDPLNKGGNLFLSNGDLWARGGPGIARSTTFHPPDKSWVWACQIEVDYDPTSPDDRIYCGFVRGSADLSGNPGSDSDGWAMAFEFFEDDGGEDVYELYFYHNGIEQYVDEFRVDIDTQETRTFYFTVGIGLNRIDCWVGDAYQTIRGMRVHVGENGLLATDQLYVAWGNSFENGEIRPTDFESMLDAPYLWPSNGYAWDDTPRLRARHLQPVDYAVPVRTAHVQPVLYAVRASHIQPITYAPRVRARHAQPICYAARGRHVQPVEYGVPVRARHVQPVEYGNRKVRARHVQPVTYRLNAHHVQPVEYAVPVASVRHVQPIVYGAYVRARHVQPVEYAEGLPRVRARHVQPCPLLGEPPIVISDTAWITLAGGQRLELTGVRIQASTGSPYWRAALELLDARDYIKLPRNTAFTLNMYGKPFDLVVEQRQLSRAVSDSGQPQESATITALSPAVVFDNPRAPALTFTWDTNNTALGIAQSVIGAIDWELLNWPVYANRFAVQSQSPMKIVQALAAGLRGIIVSRPDGSLVARSVFPADPLTFEDPQLPVAANFTDVDVFTVTEATVAVAIIDRIRIADADPSYQDRLEFKPDDENGLQGVIFAYPSPWTEKARLRSTRGSPVTVFPAAVVERQEEELVEVRAGRASVGYPVYGIVDFEYQAEHLGGIGFEPGTSQLITAKTGWSLAKVVYTTRALEARAKSDLETEAQIILERM